MIYPVPDGANGGRRGRIRLGPRATATGRGILKSLSLLTGLALAISLSPVAAEAEDVAMLTPDLLLGYAAVDGEAARFQHDISFEPQNWLKPPEPQLTAADVGAFAKDYVPTQKRVQQARHERECLAQAIYHEARGEPEMGQWAVANVILNRVVSKRYPATICGVVFQNADGPNSSASSPLPVTAAPIGRHRQPHRP